MPPDARNILEQWPGQHLVLAVDGRMFLSAMLHDGETGVYHGIWSRSPYLSSLQHNGISAELGYTRLLNDIAQGSNAGALRSSIARMEQFYLSDCVPSDHFVQGGEHHEEDIVA